MENTVSTTLNRECEEEHTSTETGLQPEQCEEEHADTLNGLYDLKNTV